MGSCCGLKISDYASWNCRNHVALSIGKNLLQKCPLDSQLAENRPLSSKWCWCMRIFAPICKSLLQKSSGLKQFFFLIWTSKSPKIFSYFLMLYGSIGLNISRKNAWRSSKCIGQFDVSNPFSLYVNLCHFCFREKSFLRPCDHA